MNRDELTIVAAVCQQYGKRIEGGYEIFIPREVLGNLSPTGVVQQPPDDPREPGVRLRYLPSRVIDGGTAQITSIEPKASSGASLEITPEPQG